MASLLGIDNGLTVTKAVIFDADGTQLAVARRRVPQSMPRPRWVERDPAGLWRATAEAIREAIHLSGRPAADIRAVAATAHGDGVYLLDRDKRPLRPGILSLDSRALDLVARWRKDALFAEALALTGQTPHVSAPSALLAWIKAEEPETYARIGHILACKDWLRFCLTGEVATDRTEASTSFTDVATQLYSPRALELFGLTELNQALPPIFGSGEIVGAVTREAAEASGLVEGTPVACGLHDVTASTLGIGAHRSGVVGIVAGTYSINEVVSEAPRTDPRWFCRNAIEPGRWNNMAISPASTANYDWFLDRLCERDQRAAIEAGQSIHVVLAEEMKAAFCRPSAVFFHPYLFGSPHGEASSASFLGLHGWHDRGDMLRAVLEGIAFNHRVHVDALRDGFPFDRAMLTGGGSRNPAFAQLFADVLAMPVAVPGTEEAAAFGAALCAGAGVGLYASPLADPRDLSRVTRLFEPNATRASEMNERYALFNRLAEAMKPYWAELEAIGSGGRG
ncbi:FGGY-family carbohydrate kinase [Aureimonas ureilytica]|uniref:FGGY-family carbohydrate kinase n=1 Tax=Aureimonas ureilytica TaxID=401562 RepID=UPI003CE98782